MQTHREGDGFTPKAYIEICPFYIIPAIYNINKAIVIEVIYPIDNISN